MTAGTTALQLGQPLRSIVGVDQVCDDPSLLTPFALEGSRPAVSVSPATAEEISAILRFSNEHHLHVVPCGGFTNQGLGSLPKAIDILLRTERLNQTLHYDPGDLTIGVSAGVKVAAVQHMTSDDNLILPLDGPRATQATIGGALATASFGPLKHGFGGSREFCIGVSFVTGDGRIAKAGGRVVKNVAGYDLMKLMIGSNGTLGVIVSANFKLFPAPRHTCTFIADFANLEEALSFRRSIQRSPLSPMCLEIISPMAHSYLSETGTGNWAIAVRAGGSDSVLSRYRRELGTAIARELDGEREATYWRTIQDFLATIQGQHHNALILVAHLPNSEVRDALTRAEQIGTENNFLFAAVGRAALASLVLAFIPISVDPPSVTQYASAVSQVRASLPRDSACVVLRCPPEAKHHLDVWGASTNDLAAMRTVKRVLDPNGILNRGRFLV